MTQESNLTVLAFAGSLRRGSYNRALLRAAKEVAPAGMTISIFEIDEVPRENGRQEPATRNTCGLREI